MVVDFDPGAPPSSVFDKGPPAALARHFAEVPDIAPEYRDLFWYDWGPVFYRGRLTGNPRLLGIASDPGPTERLVGRTLVGDAGQRVQGFLEKLGLTQATSSSTRSRRGAPARCARRCRCSRTPTTCTGATASTTWSPARASRPSSPSAATPSPPCTSGTSPTCRPSRSRTLRPRARCLAAWRTAIPDLRAAVTPDPDGSSGANYGRLPGVGLRPIPSGPAVRAPALDGRRPRGRAKPPPHNNSVERSSADLDHAMTWQAPHG